jgi:hypothetical protein
MTQSSASGLTGYGTLALSEVVSLTPTGNHRLATLNVFCTILILHSLAFIEGWR